MARKENITEALKKKKDLIDSIKKKIEENNEQVFSEPKSFALDSSFSDGMKQKFQGHWLLTHYSVDGEDFGDFLLKTRFKNKEIRNFRFEIRYVFRGNLCLKSLEVSGESKEAELFLPLDYRVKMTLSFQIFEGVFLEMIAESGYLYQLIGDSFPLLKDYQWTGKAERIRFEFQDENTLILTENEGKEVKTLVREERDF